MAIIERKKSTGGVLFISPWDGMDNFGHRVFLSVTVKVDLAVQVKGNRTDANAVWMAPLIYQPSVNEFLFQNRRCNVLNLLK